MSGIIRVGRGGAGNFMSQKDVEEAEKTQQTNDPESQKQSSLPPPSAAQTAAHTPQYVKSGRGGAGNFAEPPTMSDSLDRQTVVDQTAAAVSASHAGKPRTTGLVGRGGAGNWTDDGAATAGHDGAEGGEESEENVRRQQIAAQIAQDIDANLPAPPKTYHQHDRDME